MQPRVHITFSRTHNYRPRNLQRIRECLRSLAFQRLDWKPGMALYYNTQKKREERDNFKAKREPFYRKTFIFAFIKPYAWCCNQHHIPMGLLYRWLWVSRTVFHPTITFPYYFFSSPSPPVQQWARHAKPLIRACCRGGSSVVIKPVFV